MTQIIQVGDDGLVIVDGQKTRCLVCSGRLLDGHDVDPDKWYLCRFDDAPEFYRVGYDTQEEAAQVLGLEPFADKRNWKSTIKSGIELRDNGSIVVDDHDTLCVVRQGRNIGGSDIDPDKWYLCCLDDTPSFFRVGYDTKEEAAQILGYEIFTDKRNRLTLSGRSCEDTGAAGKRTIKYAKRDVFVFLFSIVIAVKIAIALGGGFLAILAGVGAYAVIVAAWCMITRRPI